METVSRKGEYFQLLNDFCNVAVTNWYYLLRLTKCCGHSTLVIIPKYATLSDLQKMIDLQLGEDTFDHTHFSTSEYCVYLNTIDETITVTSIIFELPLAYTVEECPYAVYQLYYDSPCLSLHL
jgi:hypothetical protein